MKRYLVTLVSIFVTGLALVPQQAFSQLDQSCPSIIQNALAQVEQICAGTNRNQVCYANSWTRAEPQSYITDFSFEPGDITDLVNIRRLQLGGLNTDLNQWGMVLMRLQANVPASLPGQNVLFLLFGDVEVEDQYGAPNSLASSPMQAIRLRTRIGGMGCDEAPPNGLLVQTPHGVGRVLLSVNGVDVSLGSTVFFTAQAGGDLTVSTLEGSALVHADGAWSAALPGTRVRVPMNENLMPDGPPGLPEPYALAEMTTLPMTALDRAVQAQPPLEGLQLAALHQQILEGGIPQIGDFSALSLDLTQPSLESLTTSVTSTLDSAATVTSGALNATTELVTNTTSAVVNTATTAVNSTVDTAQALISGALPAPVSQPIHAAADTAQTAVTEASSAATGTVNDTVSTVTNTVTETVTAATETVANVTEQTQQSVIAVQDAAQNLLPLPPLFGH